MDYRSGDVEKSIQEKYEDAFKTRFGTPASTQTWGFSDKVGTRGQTNPQRSDIDCPYDDAWVDEYLKAAKEPTELNVTDDADNTYFVEEQDSVKVVTKSEEIIPPVMPEYTWGEKVNFIIENPDYKPTTEETSSSADEIVVTKEDLDFYDENCRPVVEFEFKDKDKEDYAEVDSFINIFLNAYEKIQADETRKDWLTVTTEPVLTDTIPEEFYWKEYIPAHWEIDEDFVLNFKITERYSFSSNFNYATGRPTTVPAGRYYDSHNQKYMPYYTNRNTYRIPDYMRLDLAFNIEPTHKLTSFLHTSFSIGVYNALARKNAYNIYYVTENGKIQGYKLSVFGTAIPYVSLNIRFN